MSITRKQLEEALQEMGIPFETDGEDFVHTARGNFAPLLHCVMTIDEDQNGVTLLTALSSQIPKERRAAACELLNMVHGQSLWNVRFHLDDNGRVFSVGKTLLWGKPFNSVQFGDIFFSLLVTTDRLYPCLEKIQNSEASAAEAFENFFNRPDGE
jgi:hypothetical protein